MKYSPDGKTVTLENGTTILTYEGHKALDAAIAKEAAKGNPRFIEGSPALKWNSIPIGCHYAPMIGQIQIDEAAKRKAVQLSGSILTRY